MDMHPLKPPANGCAVLPQVRGSRAAGELLKMAAEMFSSEFDRYDKKQRPCNLYTLVGVLMALLESIFSAANSSAGLVETAIFVHCWMSRRAVPALQAALRRSPHACARRARQALAARTEPPSRMLYSCVCSRCLLWAVGLVGPCAALVDQTHEIRLE